MSIFNKSNAFERSIVTHPICFLWSTDWSFHIVYYQCVYATPTQGYAYRKKSCNLTTVCCREERNLLLGESNLT